MTEPITWQQVAGAFGKRFEKATQCPWISAPHAQDLIDLATLFNQTDNPRASGKQVLDAFFASDKAKEFGYRPSHLVKQFVLFFKSKGVTDGEQRRVEGERRYQAAKEEAEAKHMEQVRKRAAGDQE